MNQNVIGLRRSVPVLVAVALMLCVGCFIVADTEQTDAAGNWGNQTINGEIGNEVNIELDRVVGLPMSQRSDVIDEERTSDIFEKVGLTVTADYQARGLGGFENFVTITGTPTFHCDENFDIYNSNGDHWSGRITIKGVESITFDETEKHITYKGDDTETVTIIATVSPQDVQNKGIEWDVVSGPGKIIESTVTETGSVCNVEVTGTGQIVVRATHQYNTAATEDCTIFSQAEVTIIQPIDTEWKVDQEFTLTPMTDPADADIEINRVVFNGEEQDESYYGDFIYVDDRTVRATFPEAGTWEIFYSASASNYATNDGGQIRVIVTDQPVTGTPTVTGIIASPNLGHSMMFDFVAVNVTNMSTMTWDFGDGTIEPGAETVGHTYTQPGRYTVKVTVANDNGATATAETTIIVSGDEPSEEAWINVQYWWAYRIVGDAQQFSFDNSETPWLTASMQTDGEDRFIVISGTPTLTNGATVDDVYECKLTVNEASLTWQITMFAQNTVKPTAAFNVVPDPDNPLVAVVNYTGSNTSYVMIDWGDGNGYQRYTGSLSEEIRHEYATDRSYTIRIQAYNDQGSDEVSHTFNASNGDAGEVDVTLKPIKDVSVEVGHSIDIELDYAPSNAIVGMDPAYSWLSIVDGHIVGTPTKAGDYTISVIVSYGAGDKETFTIHVYEEGQLPTDPDDPSDPDDPTDPDDPKEDSDETDWVMFAACVVAMVLLAIAFVYFDYWFLVIFPMIGIIVAAWFTGVF